MARADDEYALERLGLTAINGNAETVPHLEPHHGPRALPRLSLLVHMGGLRPATRALAGRARDPGGKTEAERTPRISERLMAAQAGTLCVVGEARSRFVLAARRSM